MTPWTTAPIEATPDTRLLSWLVLELPDGSRHIVGTSLATPGRSVSDAVEAFDLERLRAITREGRVIELAGFCVEFNDADDVWGSFMREHDIDNFIDVSDNVWLAYEAAVKSSVTAEGAAPADGGDS